MERVERDVSRRTCRVLLAALVAAHLLGGALFLSRPEVPPSFDPAYHFTNTLDFYEFFRGIARRPVNGVLGDYLNVSHYYPPLTYSLVGLGFLVTGPSLTAMRFMLVLLMVPLLLLTYLAGKRMGNRRVGLLAAFVLGTYPICVGYSRVFYLDFPLLVALSFWFFTLLRAESFDSLGRSLLFGFAVGLGLLTKWFFVPLFAAPLLWTALRVLIPLSWQDMKAWLTGHFPRSLERILVWILLPAVAGGMIGSLGTGRDGVGILVGGLYFGVACLIGLSHLAVRASGRRTHPRGEVIVRRWRNFLAAMFVALLIALPWYARHLPHIVHVVRFSLEKAADPEGGMVPDVKESRWFYYFARMESQQIHAVYFLLFLASWSVVRRRERRERGLFLLFSWASGVLILSSMSLQYPRYAIGLLLYAALLTAFWVDSVPGRRQRRALIGLVVANGLALYVGRSFGLPGLGEGARRIDFPTRFADWTIYAEGGEGSHFDFSSDWGVKRITARMAERCRDTGVRSAGIHAPLVLANHTFFHYHAFTLYARMMGSSLEARTFRYVDHPAERVMEDVLNAHYVIRKTGFLGPEFTLGEIRTALEEVERFDLLNPRFFSFEDPVDLPDGSQALLYRNRLWRRNLPGMARAAADIRFEGDYHLKSLGLSPFVVSGKDSGETVAGMIADATWDVPARVPDSLLFVVQRYARDGRFLDSMGKALLDGVWLESPGGEPDRSRHRYLLLFGDMPEPISCTLKVTLWFPERDYRLPAFGKDSVRLTEDLYAFPQEIRFPVPGGTP